MRGLGSSRSRGPALEGSESWGQHVERDRYASVADRQPEWFAVQYGDAGSGRVRCAAKNRGSQRVECVVEPGWLYGVVLA